METETVNENELFEYPDDPVLTKNGSKICNVCGHDYWPFDHCPADHKGMTAPKEGPFGE